MPYSCDKIGTEKSGRKLASAAQAEDPALIVKHIPTGIPGFDDLTGGGIVASQSFILAGPSGSRKTSIMVMLLDALTKQTKRPLLLASAEQNDKDVLMFCHMLGVSNDQVKIMGNVSHVEDVLNMCDEIKPLVCGLDSLQAISDASGQAENAVARRFVAYCKRTGMCGMTTNHMTKGLEMTGTTSATHYVDTVLQFEPYMPEIDGDPVEMFGKGVLNELGVGYRKEQLGPVGEVLNLRCLRTVIKNRYGSIGNKAYFWTTKEGMIVQMERRSNVLSIHEG